MSTIAVILCNAWPVSRSINFAVPNQFLTLLSSHSRQKMAPSIILFTSFYLSGSCSKRNTTAMLKPISARGPSKHSPPKKTNRAEIASDLSGYEGAVGAAGASPRRPRRHSALCTGCERCTCLFLLQVCRLAEVPAQFEPIRRNITANRSGPAASPCNDTRRCPPRYRKGQRSVHRPRWLATVSARLSSPQRVSMSPFKRS